MSDSESRKGRAKISYPYVLSRGGAKVTVYQEISPSHSGFYRVCYYHLGRRQRHTITNENEALKRAKSALNALVSGKGASLAIDDAELMSYHRAKDILARLENSPPLHNAIETFVTVTQLLEKRPLLDFVKQHLAEERATQVKPIKVADLVEEFIRCKEVDGVSERYLQDCRSRLGRFGREFPKEIINVTTSDIDTWLRGLGHSARSRNNFRVLIVTLFRFARSAGYLPKDKRTEADSVTRAKIKGDAIEIYSPAEMQKLLDYADEHTLPLIALGGFAGLRTAEIERLHWENIKWDREIIEVTTGMSKTAQRRLVPILPNLARTLAKWRDAKATGPVIGNVKIFLRLEWLAAAAEVQWKRNALRHSFASYRLAAIQNAGALALEMGNSASIIFRHYRELVTKEDAKAWFELALGKKPIGGEKGKTKPKK